MTELDNLVGRKRAPVELNELIGWLRGFRREWADHDLVVNTDGSIWIEVFAYEKGEQK